MVKISTVYQDPDLEVSGVWFDHSAGFKVKIARSSNPAFVKAVSVLLDSVIDKIRSGSLTRDERNALIVPAIAEHLIREFALLEDEVDGKPIIYTVENATKLLTDPRLRDVRNWIIACSDEASAYRLKAQAAALGN